MLAGTIEPHQECNRASQTQSNLNQEGDQGRELGRARHVAEDLEAGEADRFVGILGDSLPREDHEQAAREGLALARREMLSGHWDLLILDEINNAVQLDLVTKEDVLALADMLPDNMDLMLTGRNAPPEFIDRADLVSEVVEIKHPYQRGEEGKKGIEW